MGSSPTECSNHAECGKLMWQWITGGVVTLVATALGALLIHSALGAAEQKGVMEERATWQAQVAKSEASRATEQVADAQKVTDAVQAGADRYANMKPIIVHSIETVKDYAQTVAGAAKCLDPERVRGIQADAASLGIFTPIPAQSPIEQVPANGSANTAGR